MELDLGKYGAKRQSWEENGRQLLKKLVSGNQSIKELTDLFIEALLEDEDGDAIRKSIIMYWITNNTRSMFRKKGEDTDIKRRKREKEVAEVKKKVKAVIRREAQKLMLETVMPNGKELRECTYKDIHKLGPAWVAIMSGLLKTLQPGEKVGDRFKNNAQLQRLTK